MWACVVKLPSGDDATIKSTPNGPLVWSWIAWMRAATAGGGSGPTPYTPSAPALLTADVRSVNPTNAMPALASGTRNPKCREKRVCSSCARRSAETRDARDSMAAPAPTPASLRTVLRLGLVFDSLDDMYEPPSWCTRSLLRLQFAADGITD